MKLLNLTHLGPQKLILSGSTQYIAVYVQGEIYIFFLPRLVLKQILKVAHSHPGRPVLSSCRGWMAGFKHGLVIPESLHDPGRENPLTMVCDRELGLWNKTELSLLSCCYEQVISLFQVCFLINRMEIE